MKPKICRFSIALLVGVLFTMTTVSCQDDDLVKTEGTVIEGLPATVDVKLDLSEMPQMTRAIIDEERSNYCDNLWLGIYLKSTGECIYNHLYTDVAGNSEQVGSKYTLSFDNLEAKSGAAYIVAAANVNTCYAVAGPKEDVSNEQKLGTLLTAADTWEKFTSICAIRSEASDISQMSYDLTMSGFYTKDTITTKNNLDPDQYNLKNIQTVNLFPGANKLSGVIKLRRLISYNKFNISAGENVTLDVISWQVFNNPYYCYVIDSEHNAGDDSFDNNGNTTLYNPSTESVEFSIADDGSQEFEFYQFENKHTACDYDGESDWVGIRNPQTVSGLTAENMYNDREREYKATNTETGYYDNSGIYKSLVNDRSDPTSMANNYASYVVLTAQVSYYIKKPSEQSIEADDDDSSLKNAEPVAYDAANKDNLIYRTAEVKYVIHLGYCEGKDDDSNPTYQTAKDFNCRRNTKYQYNVKVNGVKNIVVEAHREGEDQPGAEGTVYDAFGEYVQLDAHYNTFNIALTNNERKTLKYIVLAPYDGKSNYIYSDKIITETDIADAKQNQFYKWITFRPTTAEDKLAKYPGENSDKLWTLNELHDYANHPHSENLEEETTESSTATTARRTRADVDDETEQWYTVFIDEYVYHDGETYDEATHSYLESTWDKYVNQNDRKVELIVRSKSSTDNESEYLLCKYAFSQRSIQSYYKKVDVVTEEEDTATRSDDDSFDTENAFGLEHINESFCLNMRWDESITTTSAHNGRYNLWTSCAAVDHKWENVIQETEPEKIKAGTCRATGWSHEAAEYRVQKLKNVTTTISTTYDPTPDDTNFHNVNTACMNRNRDLNGDGIIDNNEMKWYNPTYEEYTQIMIGLAGLVSPIIEWNLYDANRYYTGKADKEFLHFACSDRQTIWAEEGFSNGPLYTSGGLFPYEIRCARHLGAKPGDEPTTDSEITTTYKRHSEDSTSDDYYLIDLPYYTDACIRPFTAGALGPNAINSSTNRVYRHFRVSKDYCKSFGKCDEYFSVSDAGELWITSNQSYQMRSEKWYNSLITNSICKNYTEEEGGGDRGTWRVPNIKEQAIMMLLKYTTLSARVPSSTYEYFNNPEFTNLTDYTCRKAFFGQLSATSISRSLFRGTGGNDLYTYIRCVKDVK